MIEDGVHKGFKKIMVLYIRSKKGTKPYKTNWVMHQYHLGSEVEKDGEYVVSKIFYQQHKQNEKNEENTMVEDSNVAAQAGPRTPKPNPPTRPCTAKCDDNFDENELLPFIQVCSYFLCTKLSMITILTEAHHLECNLNEKKIGPYLDKLINKHVRKKKIKKQKINQISSKS